jgi:hypothetical protein
LLAACHVVAAAGIAAPRPAVAEAHCGTFRASRLECVIGNNIATGVHRAGYSGVFNVTAPGAPDSAFAPAFSGINLENYFDASGRNPDRTVFFEPRHAPMTFRRLGGRTAELHQDTTPYWRVESTTRFEVRDPYYIDVIYRATPKRKRYEGDFLGIFWASYMNGPQDKSVYFLQGESSAGSPLWAQFCSQVHGRDSTVLSRDDAAALNLGDGPRLLFKNLSPLRYAAPFFYGRIRDMVVIYIFRRFTGLRFAHSPTGGGRSASGDDSNPAWDFQMVVPHPKPGQEYVLEMRVVYKRWLGRRDVLGEVQKALGR